MLGALGGARPAQRPPAPAARAPPPPPPAAASASASASAPVEIAPNLVGLRTDEHYYDFVERNRAELVRGGRGRCVAICNLQTNKAAEELGARRRRAPLHPPLTHPPPHPPHPPRHPRPQAVVNFGSSWCAHCHALLPAFLALAAAFPAARYAVAQVDGLRDAAAGVAYTPTVAVLRRGRVVDSFYGASAQALRDRLWLHAG